MSKHLRHRFGATRHGKPKSEQMLRDAMTAGSSKSDLQAARRGSTDVIMGQRDAQALARVEAKRKEGSITKEDEAKAEELEPMFQVLKRGNGYKPFISSLNCTRYPISAMDIVLQRRADGKDWRSKSCLSWNWYQAASRRRQPVPARLPVATRSTRGD